MTLAVVGDNDAVRTPPHSHEAERAVLGAVLVLGESALHELDALAVDDLLNPGHREILGTMRALRERGAAVDVLTLGEELRARGVLGKFEGGLAYLAALPSDAPVANVAHHVGIVRKLAGHRRLIALGAEIASSHAADDLAQLLEAAQRRLGDIAAATAPRAKLAALAITAGDEWLTDTLPPREHLLTDRRTNKGAVDRKGTWLFGGRGGAGKGFAVLDLTLAVVTGGDWYGLAASRRGRVLSLTAEDEADDLRRRLKLIADARYPGVTLGDRLVILPLRGRGLSFVAHDRTTGRYSQDVGLDQVLAVVAGERERTRQPFDLVVVDPIARFASVTLDTDSAAATAFIDGCDRLSEAAGGLVLATTHTNKTSRAADKGAAEATDIRGSSALSDGARGVIQLLPEVDPSTKKKTGIVVLSITKGNHVRWWDDIVLRQGDDGLLAPVDEVDRAIAVAERKSRTPERKQADRQARALEQIAGDALVVRHIMAEGYTGRLRLAVQSRLGCGQPRADVAIARVKDEDRVRVSSGVPTRTLETPQDTGCLDELCERETPPYPPGARDTGTPVVSGSGTGVPETPQDTAGHRDTEPGGSQ
ncbi:MAG TPA: AAA family ATPase [Polyangia bacterium]|nr:AAA family ATPase [Polyangia bacterium]